MKILVVSGCSNSQKHRDLPNKLRPEDFRSSDRLAQRTEELGNYKEPATEMYEGPNHKLLMEGLRTVREHNHYGKTTIDLCIISTGYGLIGEHDLIVPYDVKPEDAVWKQNPDFVYKKTLGLINDYDLVFFLLGRDIQALRLRQGSFRLPDMLNWIFILAPSHCDKLPLDLPPNRIFQAGDDLAYELCGANKYNLRGFIFKKLCEAVRRDGFGVFEQVKQDPQQLIEIVHSQS